MTAMIPEFTAASDTCADLTYKCSVMQNGIFPLWLGAIFIVRFIKEVNYD